MTSKSISASLCLRLSQHVNFKGSFWWLSLLVWLAMVAPVRAAIELRVAIQNGASQVRVGSSTIALVRDRAGRVLGQITPESAFDAKPTNNGVILQNQWQADQLWIEPTQSGYVWIGDRWYRGRTLLLSTQQGLTAINYVNLEEYLYSVLGSEMSSNWPLEALKAQAVVARSYALYQRQRSTNRPYDLGNTTGWQVYKGIDKEALTTQAAVAATAGQVVTYKGSIIDAVFHSSSGGHTENSENVWVKPLPYLQGVPDFDRGTPGFQWAKNFSNEELRSRIPGLGKIRTLEVQRQSPFGRVMSIKVVGEAGARVMKGDTLREALGLRSTLFTITPQLASNIGTNKATPVLFQVNGRGYGHGLGLSQWGAYNMALKGYNYQQIALYYYKGTALSKAEVQY